MRKASVTLAALLVALACAVPSALAGGTVPGARLVVPKLHLDAPLGYTLDAGPAWYRGSAHPGDPYTIAIAGHRTTHTHPFWSLDALKRGDRVVIVWHGVRHTYAVTGSRVVAPNDWSIAKEQGYERLILTTCTPRGSASHRLVVFALPLHSSL